LSETRTAPGERNDRLRRLVDDHFDFTWRVLRRLGLSREDADDVTQQVFMTVMQKLEDIAPGRERTYVYGVALRVATNARRKVQRRREDPYVPEVERGSEALMPDRAVELDQARALADELLSRMPAELARVLVLAEIEQETAATIAVLEGIPPGTVGSRLHRARALFRELLSQRRRPGEGES
jgi:RNA polymerase sigma-70 factor (ECF subfamily)